MRKLVRLLKRRPELAVTEFQRRWADELGPALSRLPGLRRYVQSRALPQGYARGELLFDGIEEFWIEGTADLAGFAAACGEAALLDVARTVPMAVDMHVIKDGAPPADAVKNVEFVNRRPGMDLAPFRRYWREVHGPLAAHIPSIIRYEQNHLAEAAYEGGATPPYDGLAITWFSSTAAMREGAATEAYRLTRADEANFLPDGHLPIIITRERPIRG